MKDREEIVKDINNKIYSPVYFLCGEEPYYIDLVSDLIQEKVLDDTEKEFNLTVLYGLDTDIDTIFASAKRFPMMANHQVVIVKEAQNIKNIKKLIDAKKDDPKLPADIEAALTYLDKPLKSTILVFCYKYASIDKRKAFSKMIDTKGVLMESAKIKDWDVAKWIEKYLKGKGYGIEQNACQLLADYLGNDLAKIANELSKLFLNIPVGTVINTKHIEDNIGISKDYNIFELQNALIRKDSFKANQIALYFKANQKDNPIQMTLANLTGFFSKILMMHQLAGKSVQEKAAILNVHQFFIKDYESAQRVYSEAKLHKIFTLLREYDMKSKGVGALNPDGGELLREFIFRILN